MARGGWLTSHDIHQTISSMSSSPLQYLLLEVHRVDGAEILQFHQLSLVGYLPLFTKVLYIQKVVGNGISEPSTV